MMTRSKLIFSLSILAGLALVLAACSTPTAVPSASPRPSALPATLTLTPVPPSATLTLIPPTLTAAPSATPTERVEVPTLTATPDTRPLPADWKEWPVVPTLSARAKQIYLGGLAKGNNPRAFGKVGDCQCVTASFMGFFDKPGQYTLPKAQEVAFKETIERFKGSFGREGPAVRGGFNVASVLSSLQSDPKLCNAGETPLECEFRLQKPSIVFISMETSFTGRTSDTYAKYMRQIIDFAIAQGALPILATKADNVEGNHSINLATAKLAYEYDIPLWNFWRAVQPLYNHGMDATRPDGFHISVEAWNVRSYTALETLDKMWRAGSAQ